MKKNNKKYWLILATLALFIFNGASALAQVLEIEVIGAGYRLAGPNQIAFPSALAAFAPQQREIYIGALDTQDEKDIQSALTAKDFLLIEDQNGGVAFNVTVTATDFEDSASGLSFPTSSADSSGLYIKNSNGVGAGIVANDTYTSLLGVSLNPETNDFVSLEQQPALLTSEGRAPGSWRIFPVFRANIPENTPPGTYSASITFTII
jgi:hypothetical protein